MTPAEPNRRPLRAVIGVVGLLSLVAFGIAWLMRADFVVTWPHLTVTGGEATVEFEAANHGRNPATKALRVSVGTQVTEEKGTIAYPVFGQKMLNVELAPGESRQFNVTFPLAPDHTPTLAWVEPVRE